jgi:hypothetical protein
MPEQHVRDRAAKSGEMPPPEIIERDDEVEAHSADKDNLRLECPLYIWN